MVYNFTAVTQSNTTLQLLDSLDVTVYGGSFFALMIMAIFIILIINFNFYKAKEFMLVSAFLVSFVASLFWIAGLVSFYVALVALLGAMMFMVMFFVTK